MQRHGWPEGWLLLHTTYNCYVGDEREKDKVPHFPLDKPRWDIIKPAFEGIKSRKKEKESE